MLNQFVQNWVVRIREAFILSAFNQSWFDTHIRENEFPWSIEKSTAHTESYFGGSLWWREQSVKAERMWPHHQGNLERPEELLPVSSSNESKISMLLPSKMLPFPFWWLEERDLWADLGCRWKDDEKTWRSKENSKIIKILSPNTVHHNFKSK